MRMLWKILQRLPVWPAVLALAIAVWGVVRVPALQAQDTAGVHPDTGNQAVVPAGVPAATPDTTPRHPSPLGALGRSFLIPGWGQAALHRKLTGGIFVAWEGVTLGMTLKTRQELAYLRRTNSGRGDSKRQEHEDWLVLLVFNHLFSGLEAYVSAHLTDFPGDLRFRAVPLPGGAAATLSVPFSVHVP